MNFKDSFSYDLIFFTLILFWFFGIVSQFVAIYFPSFLVITPLCKYNYSLVCHIETDKLIYYNSASTFTCARCTGIYFGALIAAFLFLVGITIKVSLKLLFLSFIPILFDIAMYYIGIYQYSITIAFFTGVLLGSVGFIYIRNILMKFINKNIGQT